MADRPRRPVNEVVHSVALAQQSALSGPLLPDVLGEWFRTHPRIQTAPRYEMPPELAEFGGGAPGLNFQVVMAPQLEPRYWLVSEDDQELLQVQSNYLALNWRRRDLTQIYPGFVNLRQRFADLLAATADGLRRHQGLLQPTRVELTYINVIQPDAVWSTHAETDKIINLSIAGGAPYESVGFTLAQAIHEEDGRFSGRLRVALQPTLDWVKKQPQLNLTITVRSAELADHDIASALRFLDRAHDRAKNVFFDLLTDKTKEAWGIG